MISCRASTPPAIHIPGSLGKMSIGPRIHTTAISKAYKDVDIAFMERPPICSLLIFELVVGTSMPYGSSRHKRRCSWSLLK